MSKISELSDGGVIQGGDTLIAVRSGGNVKVTYGGSTTANIDGGTIDGTTIGGTTPAAGSFTTLQADTSLNVDGTVTADGLTVDGDVSISDSVPILRLDSPAVTWSGGEDLGGIDWYTEDTSGNGPAVMARIYSESSGTNTLPIPNMIFQTSVADVALKDRMKIDGTGDISFYEDTGTTAKLFWDASTERLGIGNSSPTTALDVTGTVTADGLTVEDGAPVVNISSTTLADLATIQFTTSGSTVDSKITHQANTGVMTIDSGRNATWGGKIDFVTDTDTRMRINNNGDISFYEDTGTTAKLFWDASAESLGIGTSSPSGALDIGGQHILYDNYDALGASFTRNGAYGSVLSLGRQGVSSGVTLDYPADNTFALSTNSTERMRIDSSGNVKIGTGSDRYSYLTASTANLQIDGGLVFEPGSGNNVEIFNYRSTNMLFGNSGAENMRLDASGNLLVGTTDPIVYNEGSTGNSGVVISADNYYSAARKNGPTLFLNRQASDGAIAQFYKDGTIVGSIGVDSGDNLYIGGSAASHSGLYFGTNIVAPLSAGSLTDDAIDLGNASYRFDDVYATNGTIQTSDRNEKQDIEALSDAEQRVAVACKGLLRKFRWKSSVAENGDDARIHFGIIAQDLQAAFEAEGLDAGRYAMFISTTWTDEETGEERTRMGVRYSELLAFIIAAI